MLWLTLMVLKLWGVYHWWYLEWQVVRHMKFLQLIKTTKIHGNSAIVANYSQMKWISWRNRIFYNRLFLLLKIAQITLMFLQSMWALITFCSLTENVSFQYSKQFCFCLFCFINLKPIGGYIYKKILCSSQPSNHWSAFTQTECHTFNLIIWRRSTYHLIV